MIVSILLLLTGLIILTAGAESLVRGASSLALRFGVSPLVVGLTVVAFGTSAPELAVSLKASFAGVGDLAVGNIVGSNIFNISVILGISALLSPLRVEWQLIQREMPVMVGASILFLILARGDEGVTRWEAGILFSGIVLYTVLSIWQARREKIPNVDSIVPVQADGRGYRKTTSLVLVVLGFAMLVFGSRLMVDHAVLLAKMLGMSDAVIGLTIVAAGTSMPELATSVVAAIRREADIAVGNVIGSNIFNVLSIGGLTGLICPPLRGVGITAIDLGFMLGTSLLVLPLMWTGFVLKRWEGALLLLVFGCYLYFLWP